MKQHITTEQILEIGYEKCVNIVIDSSKQDRFIREYELSDSKPQWEEYVSEQFTIGKMIEILEKYNVTDIGIAMNTCKNNISVWEDNGCICRIIKDELCDSLWEAVKQVMKA